jgi:hypothetical protein
MWYLYQMNERALPGNLQNEYRFLFPPHSVVCLTTSPLFLLLSYRNFLQLQKKTNPLHYVCSVYIVHNTLVDLLSAHDKFTLSKLDDNCK